MPATSAGLLHVVRLLEQRLGGVLLRARDVERLAAATTSRYRLTATSTTRSRAVLMPSASALARSSAAAAQSFSARRSKTGCDSIDPRVEHVERPDDRTGRTGSRTPRG